jgi:putative hydrolase of the HAD superfamily
MTTRPAVWLFDLDNTLHDASHAAFGDITREMTRYMIDELAVAEADADTLRRDYLRRYGATLLGLVRHHGVDVPHFLALTHTLPGLEERLRCHRHDVAALKRLRGRRYVVTNAPLGYARRVLAALGIAPLFDGVIPIEQMRMFGQLRPKPDARMLRRLAVRLRTAPARCVLVEDTLGHLKSARGIGMRTVWMQRFTRSATWGIAHATRVSMRPAYVDHRIRGLAALARRAP